MNLDPGMAKWPAKHEGEWNGPAALIQMIRETSNMLFIFGGDPNDPRWVQAREQIQNRFDWKEWEASSFMQTGVKFQQKEDHSFVADQIEYVKTLEKVDISPERGKEKDASTTDEEKSQMRAIP